MTASGKPRRAAAAGGAALQEQWRSLDGMLDSLAKRARGYAAADGDEESAAPVAGVEGPALSALRQERDQLRRLLASAHAELRAARGEIREMRERLRVQHNAEVSRGPLAAWWTRWLRLLR